MFMRAFESFREQQFIFEAAVSAVPEPKRVQQFRGFFPKLEFVFIILILPKGTAKLRWGEGGGEIYLGCTVAQLVSSVAQ